MNVTRIGLNLATREQENVAHEVGHGVQPPCLEMHLKASTLLQGWGKHKANPNIEGKR